MRRAIEIVGFSGLLLAAGNAYAQTVGVEVSGSANAGVSTAPAATSDASSSAPQGTSESSSAPAGASTESAASATEPAGVPSDRGAPAASSRPRFDPQHLPFRNSSLILDQSITPETVFAGAQLSQIPSYQWWISFRPRWYFNDNLSLRARADLTTEFFAQSETTRVREPVVGDLWTDLVYTGFPQLAGFKFSAGARALWPLSMASRARSNVVALGAVVGSSRRFDHLPGGGDLTLGLSFAGTHAFTAYSSGGILGTYDCGSLDPSVPTQCNSTGGPMNAAFNLTSILTVGYNTPVRGLGVNFMYLVANAWLYRPPPAVITDPMAGSITVGYDSSATYMRQNTWFLASVDYELSRELSLSVGYYCYRPLLNPDSSYGNPFWAPGGASRIFLSATLALDGIYQTIVGTPRTTAGTHAARRQPGANQVAQNLREQQLLQGTF